MKKGYQNLHVHTLTSDGELTYKQVLDLCAANNISVVAFTDHDSLPDKKALGVLEKNRDHATKWIIGIEISSGWPKEIGGPASNFHIVGLFVNPFDPDLKKHCQKAKQARQERMKKMVKNLKSLGFDITEEDCLKVSGGETVGRRHIVTALCQKAKNIEIIGKLKDKMAREAKKNPAVKKKYQEMIGRGPNQYPYRLFLDDKAFIKGVFVNYLYWVDMDKSVELIRRAQGIAILAHWTFSKHMVGEKLIDKFFKQERLDGAEIVFGCDSKTNLKDSGVLEDMKTMEKLTQKHGVIRSGGGDSHTRDDFKRFVRAKWLAQKTVGMVQKMKQKKKLNLKNSSLK